MGHSSKQKYVVASLIEIDAGEEDVVVEQKVVCPIDGWITKKTHILSFDGEHTKDLWIGCNFTTTTQEGSVSGNLQPYYKGLVEVIQAPDKAIHMESVNLPDYAAYEQSSDEAVQILESKTNIPVSAGQDIIHEGYITANAAITTGVVNIYSVVEITIACLTSTRPTATMNSKNSPTKNVLMIRSNNTDLEIAWKAPCNGRIGNIRTYWIGTSSGEENIIAMGKFASGFEFPDEPDEIAVIIDSDSLFVTHGVDPNEVAGVTTNHYSGKMFFKKGELFRFKLRNGEGDANYILSTWDFIPEFDSDFDWMYNVGTLTPETFDIESRFETPYDVYMEEIDIDWVGQSATSAAGFIHLMAIKPGQPDYDLAFGPLRDGGQILGAAHEAVTVADKLPGFLGTFAYKVESNLDTVTNVGSGSDKIKVHDYWPAGTMLIFYHETTKGSLDPATMITLDGRTRTKHNNWNNYYYFGHGIQNQELVT